YGAPQPVSLVDVLVGEGYDVWIENWRASIDFPRQDYTLEHAAVFDHPAAVRTILDETGHDTLKAMIHCQGSTSFMMSAVAGLVPEVTTVVSNAVSLHPELTRLSKLKLLRLIPPSSLVMSGIDPQWAIRAPSTVAASMAAAGRLLRRECDNPVCALSTFMYGVGPDVLWRHENLDASTHEWVGREFGYPPLPRGGLPRNRERAQRRPVARIGTSSKSIHARRTRTRGAPFGTPLAALTTGSGETARGTTTRTWPARRSVDLIDPLTRSRPPKRWK